MEQITKSKKDHALELITPSSFSGFLCVFIAIIVPVLIIISTNLKGSTIQRDFLYYNFLSTDLSSGDSLSNDSVSQLYNFVRATISSKSNFIANTFLFFFWGVVGLLAYFFITGILKGLSEAKEVEQELHDARIKRKELIREELVKLGIRALTIIGWLLFIKLGFSVIVPYILALVYIGAPQITTIFGVLYSLGAVVLIALYLHTHIIFLRLLLLRARVFGTPA